jgi:hypothetical protein
MFTFCHWGEKSLSEEKKLYFLEVFVIVVIKRFPLWTIYFLLSVPTKNNISSKKSKNAGGNKKIRNCRKIAQFSQNFRYYFSQGSKKHKKFLIHCSAKILLFFIKEMKNG